jgi:hypothetical protein
LAAFFPMSAKAALSLSFEMIAGGGKDRLIESLSALRRRLPISPDSFPRQSQWIEPFEEPDDPHWERLLQFPQLPCSLAQLVFYVLFLALDRAQPMFRVLSLPLRLALQLVQPVFQVLLLAFFVIDERAKSILNCEKLTLHFRPENASRRRDVRLAGWDASAMRAHSGEAFLTCSNLWHLS